MSDITFLSASQINLFTECERKWAFQYIEKRERTTHPSAALGTEVQDTQLDPWLMSARAFDFTRPSGEIALALTPLLPKPMTPGMQLRRKFEIPSPRGTFWYRGELDIYAPDSACVPGLDGGVPLVGDIKTTSNLAYAKSNEDLKIDIQAQLYAMTIMFEENVDVIDLVWFYTRTRKPHRVQRSYARVTASHVVEQFQRIDEIGSRVRAIKEAKPKAEDLPPNIRMCDSYGGCPFRHVCSGATSPAVQSAAVNREAVEMNQNSFLNNLRKQTGAPPAAAPVAVPASAQPPTPAPAPPAPAPEALPAWATAPVDPRAPKPAINPPEAALPPAPPVNAPIASAPAEAPKAKRGRPAKDAGAPAEIEAGIGPDDIAPLVALMRGEGIRRLALLGVEIELFEAKQ